MVSSLALVIYDRKDVDSSWSNIKLVRQGGHQDRHSLFSPGSPGSVGLRQGWRCCHPAYQQEAGEHRSGEGHTARPTGGGKGKRRRPRHDATHTPGQTVQKVVIVNRSLPAHMHIDTQRYLLSLRIKKIIFERVFKDSAIWLKFEITSIIPCIG